MFIKFGDKTEKVVVKNSLDDNRDDDDGGGTENDNEEEMEDVLYDRRSQLLNKYKNKKLHKNI